MNPREFSKGTILRKISWIQLGPICLKDFSEERKNGKGK